MALSVNATVSMPPEMVEDIDAARGSMSRAKYIRTCIRNYEGTPFDPADNELPDFSDTSTENNEVGGVA